MENKIISISDVKAGDVILSLGEGLISSLIRDLDGGDYSHAAFFDGEKIIEATFKGVVASSLEATMEVQKQVDVYRFVNDSGDTFSLPNWPVKPVEQRAGYYLDKGTGYAYDHLVLIGLLLLFKRGEKVGFRALYKLMLYKKGLKTAVSDINTLDSEIHNAIIAEIQDLLLDIHKAVGNYNEKKGVKSVICSELVYRSYFEANPETKYRLRIINSLLSKELFKESENSNLHVKLSNHTNIEQQFDDLRNTFNGIYPELFLEKNDLELQKYSNNKVIAALVTPENLQSSPNLVKVGSLKTNAVIDKSNKKLQV